MNRNTTLWLMLVLSLPVAPQAVAQTSGYSDYYRQNQSSTRNLNPGTNRYLYDKHFYHNPAVSPYLSAVRGGSDSGTAYTTSVRPELERRAAASRAQAAYIQQRKQQGNVGYTVYPGAGFKGTASANPVRPPAPRKPSAYQNHWYGGWNR